MEVSHLSNILNKSINITELTPIVKHNHTHLAMLPLLTVCIGFFMVCLDTTVVNVALQDLRLSLHTNLSGLQWTVDSYVLAFATLLLSAGALGDYFGPRKIFTLGLILFTASSILCGLAESLNILIFARVLQGVGSALLVATSLSILQRLFADASIRARAFGVWGAAGGVAVAFGPVLGGFLISAFSWRSIFLLNVPFGILGIFMTFLHLPKMAGTPKHINIFSQLTSIIILGSAAYIFIEAGAIGWGAFNVNTAILIFSICVILFLMSENLSKHPMLPSSIFKIKNFSAAVVVGIVINFGFYGQLFVLSLYFQQTKDYSVLQTGFAFLPQAIVCAVTAFYCGKVTAKKGAGFPIAIGLCTGILGFLGLIFMNINSSYWTIMLPMLAIGFAISFVAPATVSAAMSSSLNSQSGIVSGIINTVRQSGSLMGVAVLGSFIGHKENLSINGLHIAFIVAAISYFIGLLFTIFWILPKRK